MSSSANGTDESSKSSRLNRENSHENKNSESNPISDWQSQLTSKNEAILKSIEELIDQSLQNNPEEA